MNWHKTIFLASQFCPLSCYCVDQSQLSQAFPEQGRLLSHFVEWLSSVT